MTPPTTEIPATTETTTTLATTGDAPTRPAPSSTGAATPKGAAAEAKTTPAPTGAPSSRAAAATTTGGSSSSGAGASAKQAAAPPKPAPPAADATAAASTPTTTTTTGAATATGQQQAQARAPAPDTIPIPIPSTNISNGKSNRNTTTRYVHFTLTLIWCQNRSSSGCTAFCDKRAPMPSKRKKKPTMTPPTTEIPATTETTTTLATTGDAPTRPAPSSTGAATPKGAAAEAKTTPAPTGAPSSRAAAATTTGGSSSSGAGASAKQAAAPPKPAPPAADATAAASTPTTTTTTGAATATGQQQAQARAPAPDTIPIPIPSTNISNGKSNRNTTTQATASQATTNNNNSGSVPDSATASSTETTAPAKPPRKPKKKKGKNQQPTDKETAPSSEIQQRTPPTATTPTAPTPESSTGREEVTSTDAEEVKITPNKEEPQAEKTRLDDNKHTRESSPPSIQPTTQASPPLAQPIAETSPPSQQPPIAETQAPPSPSQRQKLQIQIYRSTRTPGESRPISVIPRKPLGLIPEPVSPAQMHTTPQDTPLAEKVDDTPVHHGMIPSRSQSVPVEPIQPKVLSNSRLTEELASIIASSPPRDAPMLPPSPGATDVQNLATESANPGILVPCATRRVYSRESLLELKSKPTEKDYSSLFASLLPQIATPAVKFVPPPAPGYVDSWRNPWRPAFKVRPSLPKPSSSAWKRPTNLDQTQQILTSVKRILNKITEDTYNLFINDLCSLQYDSPDLLTGLVSEIFFKAQRDKKRTAMYARLCVDLAQTLSTKQQNQHTTDSPQIDESMDFRRVLLNRCQSEFKLYQENRSFSVPHTTATTTTTDTTTAAATTTTSTTTAPSPATLTQDEQEARQKGRDLFFGYMAFVAELYNNALLNVSVICRICSSLLTEVNNIQTVNNDFEVLAFLLSKVGKKFEAINSTKDLNIRNYIFEQIEANWKNNAHLSPRVKFKLQDVLEMRQRKWEPTQKPIVINKSSQPTQVHMTSNPALSVTISVTQPIQSVQPVTIPVPSPKVLPTYTTDEEIKKLGKNITASFEDLCSSQDFAESITSLHELCVPQHLEFLIVKMPLVWLFTVSTHPQQHAKHLSDLLRTAYREKETGSQIILHPEQYVEGINKFLGDIEDLLADAPPNSFEILGYIMARGISDKLMKFDAIFDLLSPLVGKLFSFLPRHPTTPSKHGCAAVIITELLSALVNCKGRDKVKNWVRCGIDKVKKLFDPVITHVAFIQLLVSKNVESPFLTEIPEKILSLDSNHLREWLEVIKDDLDTSLRVQAFSGILSHCSDIVFDGKVAHCSPETCSKKDLKSTTEQQTIPAEPIPDSTKKPAKKKGKKKPAPNPAPTVTTTTPQNASSAPSTAPTSSSSATSGLGKLLWHNDLIAKLKPYVSILKFLVTVDDDVSVQSCCVTDVFNNLTSSIKVPDLIEELISVILNFLYNNEIITETAFRKWREQLPSSHGSSTSSLLTLSAQPQPQVDEATLAHIDKFFEHLERSAEDPATSQPGVLLLEGEDLVYALESGPMALIRSASAPPPRHISPPTLQPQPVAPVAARPAPPATSTPNSQSTTAAPQQQQQPPAVKPSQPTATVTNPIPIKPAALLPPQSQTTTIPATAATTTQTQTNTQQPTTSTTQQPTNAQQPQQKPKKNRNRKKKTG
ncbi:MIF4G domain [Pelomyxa schiedti]|nr:MIF4G domain [Pelomyxa schiedti]